MTICIPMLIRAPSVSSIKDLLKEDPKYPRRLHFSIETHEGLRDNYGEFDNPESCREWRREIKGALYMYRHRRAENLYKQSKDEDTSGVRISVPLSRVQSFSERKLMNIATILKVEVSKVTREDIEEGEISSADEIKLGPINPGVDGDDESDDSDLEDDSSVESSERSSESKSESVDGRTLEIGVVQRKDPWVDFDHLVKAAKEREVKAGIHVPARTFVDFGALTYTERHADPQEAASTKESSIRRALSLGGEPEVWCACSSSINPCQLQKLTVAMI